METADVVIVGAGHGGAQCAIALRQNGFTGTIAMIGREPEPPYERPPLSKEYFAREKTFDRLYIRPPQFWADKEIELMLSTEVTGGRSGRQGADALRRHRRFGYGTLVWATGGDPRRLSCVGADLAGVHAVRTRADCDRLMGEIDAGVQQHRRHRRRLYRPRSGGGADQAGLPGDPARSAAARAGARRRRGSCRPSTRSEHRDHGVDLRTGVAVDCLVGEGRRRQGHRRAPRRRQRAAGRGGDRRHRHRPRGRPADRGRRGGRQRRRRRRISAAPRCPTSMRSAIAPPLPATLPAAR